MLSIHTFQELDTFFFNLHNALYRGGHREMKKKEVNWPQVRSAERVGAQTLRPHGTGSEDHCPPRTLTGKHERAPTPIPQLNRMYHVPRGTMNLPLYGAQQGREVDEEGRSGI